MARSRIKTKTTYFIVTTNGKLVQMHPSLMVLFALVIVAMVTLFARQGFHYNQSLVDEKKQIQVKLEQLNNAQKQLSDELSFCEDNKEKICRLLYFKTDSEKKSHE